MLKRYRLIYADAALAAGLWLVPANEASASDSAQPRAAVLAGGADFSVMAETDGTLWAWGANHDGQLGTGDDMTHSSPNQVTAADGHPLTIIASVAAGGRHALAVRTDGTLWTLGEEPGGSRPHSVSIDAGTPLDGVIAAAAGAGHDLALLSDGTVWTWSVGGRLKVMVYLKDKENRPLSGQRLKAQVSAGTVESFRELYEGCYQANWTLPSSGASAKVKVFLRGVLVKEATYPPES